MDPLQITPPFTYSYQCGSTLLVAYIPVYMYSITIQILFQTFKVGMFSLINRRRRFENFLPWLGLVPSQVISNLMNNILLLLSFGLCSPVLGCYIILSICMSSITWQILIGRSVREQVRLIEILSNDDLCVRNTIELTKTSEHKLQFTDSTLNLMIVEESWNQKNEFDDPVDHKSQLKIVPDHFLGSAQSSISSILICKWPILWTSCIFITLLCWEIVGDQVGWYGGWWVLLFGGLIMCGIWVWNVWLLSK
jgi:hypothetical protein